MAEQPKMASDLNKAKWAATGKSLYVSLVSPPKSGTTTAVISPAEEASSWHSMVGSGPRLPGKHNKDRPLGHNLLKGRDCVWPTMLNLGNI